MTGQEESFTISELMAVEEQGHVAWHDGYCYCWVASEFGNDAPLHNMEHFIDVMRKNRENK